MRKDTVITFSIQDLEKKGFKKSLDGSRWYLGSAKYPMETIRSSLEHLLGREMEVVSIEESKITVEEYGEFYKLPNSIIKRRPAKKKVHKRIFRDDVLKFNGYNFDFSCALRHANIEEARQVAKWVLQVTK